MVDDGAIEVVRNIEAQWPTGDAGDGGPVISAYDNSVPSGSTLIGGQDTHTGLTAQAFKDAGAGDLRPSDTNYSLRGLGTANPPTITGHEFDGGL